MRGRAATTFGSTATGHGAVAGTCGLRGTTKCRRGASASGSSRAGNAAAGATSSSRAAGRSEWRRSGWDLIAEARKDGGAENRNQGMRGGIFLRASATSVRVSAFRHSPLAPFTRHTTPPFAAWRGNVRPSRSQNHRYCFQGEF